MEILEDTAKGFVGGSGTGIVLGSPFLLPGVIFGFKVGAITGTILGFTNGVVRTMSDDKKGYCDKVLNKTCKATMGAAAGGAMGAMLGNPYAAAGGAVGGYVCGLINENPLQICLDHDMPQPNPPLRRHFEARHETRYNYSMDRTEPVTNIVLV